MLVQGSLSTLFITLLPNKFSSQVQALCNCHMTVGGNLGPDISVIAGHSGRCLALSANYLKNTLFLTCLLSLCISTTTKAFGTLRECQKGTQKRQNPLLLSLSISRRHQGSLSADKRNAQLGNHKPFSKSDAHCKDSR